MTLPRWSHQLLHILKHGNKIKLLIFWRINAALVLIKSSKFVLYNDARRPPQALLTRPKQTLFIKRQRSDIKALICTVTYSMWGVRHGFGFSCWSNLYWAFINSEPSFAVLDRHDKVKLTWRTERPGSRWDHTSLCARLRVITSDGEALELHRFCSWNLILSSTSLACSSYLTS